MTRWRLAWIGAFLASILVLLNHSSGGLLLEDSDTSVLLRAIRARNAPFSWFLGDWPLFNHFYRPVPTLTFELDSRLYGNNAIGYGWTNAILAAACVLALFWFVRELLDSPAQAVLCAWLFALWQTRFPYQLPILLQIAAIAVILIGGARHRSNWRAYVPAFFTMLLLAQLVTPLQPLQGRILAWLPGRTASTMTLLALLALASCARVQRLLPVTIPESPPGPLDPPATRSTRLAAPSRFTFVFGVLAVLFAALTFASYEQAVMLPACLLAVAVYFRLRGRPILWGWQIAFWALLGGYLALRHQIIPPGTSAYQAQQLRSLKGGASMDLSSVAFPPLATIPSFLVRLDEGLFLMFNPELYADAFGWAVFLVGGYQLRRAWKPALTGWALCLLSFLPMAFLKHFEHYYYWPMALQTVLVVTVACVAWSLASIAVSPPALQAPPRLRPAPGSLPRR